jgi:hypothetical protein
MERHLLYLRAQLEAVEKKEEAMGVSYVEEKTILTELYRMASPQICHIDTVGPEFWTDCLRAYLLVEDVLAYRLTTKRHYSQFAGLFAQMVESRFGHQNPSIGIYGNFVRTVSWRINRAPSQTPSDRRPRVRNTRKVKSTGPCYRCLKFGHLASQCSMPCKLCRGTGHTEGRCERESARRTALLERF